MRRREVIGLLTAAALPVRAWAQNARKVYRLGVLAQSSRWLDEVGRVLLLPELARQGFVEGSNLVVDFRSGADENLEGLAGKLVERAPDAILTIASPPTRAARTRTSTVPIVLYGGQDAVAEGFAETLARPGGNVTGVVIMSVQLEAKRLQLLNEAVPAARRITALLYGVDEPLRSRQNTRTPDHGSRAASSVRSPSGGFSTSAVEWRPQRGQRLFLPSHCFRSSPSPCLPSCGRKSSPATVDRYDGQKYAGSPAGRSTAVVRFNARRGMSADASTACIRRAPGRLARCASWRRLRHFRPLGLHAASERVHQVDDVLR
jgi:hypothetical protein